MLCGALTGADLARLCARVQSLLELGNGDAVVCDVGEVGTPDAGMVDLLARLQLMARRRGGRIRLQRASPQLLELVALCGLRDVLEFTPPADGPAGRTAGTASPCPETR